MRATERFDEPEGQRALFAGDAVMRALTAAAMMPATNVNCSVTLGSDAGYTIQSCATSRLTLSPQQHPAVAKARLPRFGKQLRDATLAELVSTLAGGTTAKKRHARRASG